MERAAIINGKICIVRNASVMGLGIQQFRKSLRQIENSKLELKESAISRAKVLRDGIALWEARA